MPTFQSPILNASPATVANGVGEAELERRRLALQHALGSCLTVEQLAQTVRLCEQEFAEKASVSVADFCQRLFDTMPQLQLDTQARLRLLQMMRQSVQQLAAETVIPALNTPEPMPPAAPAPLVSPEDSTNSDLFWVAQTPPAQASPEDSVSPEFIVMRYTHVEKDMLG
jgi:hypothetical protein